MSDMYRRDRIDREHDGFAADKARDERDPFWGPQPGDDDFDFHELARRIRRRMVAEQHVCDGYCDCLDGEDDRRGDE